MRKFILLLALSCSLTGWAWERQSVWPKGRMPDAQEHQIAAMTTMQPLPPMTLRDANDL